MIKEFIECHKDKNVETRYYAGRIGKDSKRGCFRVICQQYGAEESFSVGQPVYDENGNIMGYLGIGLCSDLDYAVNGIRIPVEYWEICLSTEHCMEGKRVYTYWQNKQRLEE